MKSKYLNIKRTTITVFSMVLVLLSLGSTASYANIDALGTNVLFDDVVAERVVDVIDYELEYDFNLVDEMMEDLGNEDIAQSLLMQNDELGDIGFSKAAIWDISKNGFKDIQPDAWYSLSAKTLFDKEIVKGYPDGEFKGNNKLLVNEFLTMMVRAHGWDVRQPAEGEDWFIPYLQEAMGRGLINMGDFKDYKLQITREEMSYIITNSVEISDKDIVYPDLTKVSASMKDYSSIDTKYKESVNKSYALGLLAGYPSGNFVPKGILSRAEAVVVINRLIDASLRKVFVVNNDWSSLMKGGANWSDPLLMGSLKNMEYREKYIPNPVSNLTPSRTSKDDFNLGLSDEILTKVTDFVAIGIMYGGSTQSEIDAQLKEMRFEVGRRLEKNEYDILMKYLSKKTSDTTSVYEKKAFTFTNSTPDERDYYHEVFFFENYFVIIGETYTGGIFGSQMKSGGLSIDMYSNGGSYTPNLMKDGVNWNIETIYK